MSAIFAPPPASADLLFGQTTGNHRYKMPLMPGERGTKSGGNWVPYHMRSATNLAGAISESFALGVWEREQGYTGLAMNPDLYEMLVVAVNRARMDPAFDPQRMKDSATGKALKEQLADIHAAARERAGADRAAQEGTNRHDVWETRGRSGIFVGTPEINDQMERLEKLLERSQFTRVPHLIERVIRNTEVDCAGRFDEVLIHQPTGRLVIADLKTKRRPFFSLLELWIQLAIYSRARWMLTHVGEDAQYEDGPLTWADQKYGAILHMPADAGQPGAQPMRIRRVDLEKGWRYALLAKSVVDARSDGKSVESMADSFWAEEIDPAQWGIPAITS